MKNKTTTLTITVVNPQGENHYLLTVTGVKMSKILMYSIFLFLLGCHFSVIVKSATTSLIIYEPNLTDLEIARFNNRYFLKLGISHANLVAVHLPNGNHVFWTLFDDEQVKLLKFFLSALSMEEIGNKYFLSEKRMEEKLTELLAIIKISYQVDKPKNRKQLRMLAIKLGAYVCIRCVTCNQIL